MFSIKYPLFLLLLSNSTLNILVLELKFKRLLEKRYCPNVTHILLRKNYDEIESYVHNRFSKGVTKDNLFVENAIFMIDNGQF